MGATKVITQNRVVDGSGEVVYESVRTVERTTEEDFIKVYFRAMIRFPGLKEMTARDHQVMYALMPHLSYADAGQTINLNRAVKERMIDDLDWERGKASLNRLDKELSRLSKLDLIKRVGTGTYVVNPHLFGRGEWKDIRRLQGEYDG